MNNLKWGLNPHFNMKGENMKESSRDLVKRLYLDENKNYEEISEELGLSLNTIKLYITQGGYNKNPRHKRKSKVTTKPKEVLEETKAKINVEKPYADIGEGYVIYEGRLMRKMTKEEFVEAMLRDQKLKNLKR